MDQSILYNLRNPAFVEDIGYSMINRQYPCTVDTLTGFNTFPQGQINNGQLTQDKFDNNKPKKSKSIFKKILIAGAIIGLGAFALKKGNSLIKGIKNTVSKLWSKLKK